jgi:hypothetical protein
MTVPGATNHPGFNPSSMVRGQIAFRTRALASCVGVSALLVFSSWAAEYSEAPVLHEWVLSGELPPVEQRMPHRPLLLQPLESVGRYGGVWRMVTLELNDPGFVFQSLGYEPLVRWGAAVAAGDSRCRRTLGGERGRDPLHILSAAGIALVGRCSIHGGRRDVLA